MTKSNLNLIEGENKDNYIADLMSLAKQWPNQTNLNLIEGENKDNYTADLMSLLNNDQIKQTSISLNEKIKIIILQT